MCIRDRANKVKIGDNVKVQNNVSIYDEVTLQSNVFCGPSVVFTYVKNPRSKLCRKNEYIRNAIRNRKESKKIFIIIC